MTFQLEGAVDMSQRTSYEQLLIAILGPPKSGKSHLAVTAPKEMPDKPLYKGLWLVDWDGRKDAIAGTAGVIAKTYRDIRQSNAVAWPAFQADLGMIEYAKSQGKEIPATIVLDSRTYMGIAALNYGMTQSTAGSREIGAGGFKMRIPNSWDPFTVECSYILNVYQRIIELGCNLIVCYHEREEEAKDSTQTQPKFTGKISTDPPRAKSELALFNELWRMNDNGTYRVQTKPDTYGKFIAGTALNIDGDEEPSIEKMIEKHISRSKGTK